MKTSKRVDITFQGEGCKRIETSKIVAAQAKMTTTMTKVVREFKQHEANSKRLASRVVLNA